MKLTREDPVVQEIRAVRRELAGRFGDDVNALCDFLALSEAEHEHRLVNHPAKAPERVRTGAPSRGT